MKKRAFTIIALIVIPIILARFSPASQQQQNRRQQRKGQEKYYSLKGRVVDWDARYVGKAVVLIPELGKSLETDERGAFEFTEIPQGRYHVEVFAEGFLGYSSDPFLLDDNMSGFDIVLIKTLTEHVVVTATRTEKLFTETPVRIAVISREDIEKKAPTNLADTLYQTTGVRVENDCQNCNFTQVRINGMEGKYTQILIDSSPVISAMTGVYGLEQIPAEMLDRIEIVKGGGSALYGGNAVAGVINILTRVPTENKTILKLHQESITGKPFTNLGFRSSLVSKDLNTKAYLFGSYQDREPVDLNDDGFSELGSISNTSFGLNIYNYFSAINSDLKLSLFRIFEERRGGNLFDMPPHEADTAEWAKTDQLGFSTEWNHYLAEKLHYNLSLSLVDAKRDTYYGSHKDPNAYGMTKNPLLFLNCQVNYQTGGHVFSLGAQYKTDKIKDKATGYNRVIEEVYQESGLFLQDDFRIGNTFSFLTGIRLNRHSALERVIFTPRLSILIKFMRDLSFRTSISTGFRAPQVFDEDLHITQVGGGGMMVTNSPDLKEEKSYSINSGFDYGRQIGQNLIQFSAEVFYNKLADTFILHEIARIENARIFERINGSGSRVYGLSIDFGLVLGPQFSLASGWTFQRSRLDEPEPDFNSREFFRTPNSYGFVSLSFKNRKLVNVDLSGEYTGPMKAPHYAGYIDEDRLETTPSFWVLNLKLHRPINITGNYTVSVFLGASNLFGSYQTDLDKGENRDSGYVYGPSRPRSFYVGFEFSF